MIDDDGIGGALLITAQPNWTDKDTVSTLIILVENGNGICPGM